MPTSLIKISTEFLRTIGNRLNIVYRKKKMLQKKSGDDLRYIIFFVYIQSARCNRIYFCSINLATN